MYKLKIVSLTSMLRVKKFSLACRKENKNGKIICRVCNKLTEEKNCSENNEHKT